MACPLKSHDAQNRPNGISRFTRSTHFVLSKINHAVYLILKERGYNFLNIDLHSRIFTYLVHLWNAQV